MFIQIQNLPCGTTEDELYELLGGLSMIDHITIADSHIPEHVVAWVAISCSQTGANAISNKLEGRMFNGRHVSSYAALFLH